MAGAFQPSARTEKLSKPSSNFTGAAPWATTGMAEAAAAAADFFIKDRRECRVMRALIARTRQMGTRKLRRQLGVAGYSRHLKTIAKAHFKAIGRVAFGMSINGGRSPPLPVSPRRMRSCAVSEG